MLSNPEENEERLFQKRCEQSRFFEIVPRKTEKNGGISFKMQTPVKPILSDRVQTPQLPKFLA